MPTLAFCTPDLVIFSVLAAFLSGGLYVFSLFAQLPGDVPAPNSLEIRLTAKTTYDCVVYSLVFSVASLIIVDIMRQMLEVHLDQESVRWISREIYKRNLDDERFVNRYKRDHEQMSKLKEEQEEAEETKAMTGVQELRDEVTRTERCVMTHDDNNKDKESEKNKISGKNEKTPDDDKKIKGKQWEPWSQDPDKTQSSKTVKAGKSLKVERTQSAKSISDKFKSIKSVTTGRTRSNTVTQTSSTLKADAKTKKANTTNDSLTKDTKDVEITQSGSDEVFDTA